MSYGYVYVAQISMGADSNQTVKALAEAEGISGTVPDHRLRSWYQPWYQEGYVQGQTEEELAVKCGYWHNFRFNPAADNKFTLDSKAPSGDYQEFLDGEVRYNSLKRANPEKAARLFAKNEAEAKERYAYLNKLVTLYGTRIKSCIQETDKTEMAAALCSCHFCAISQKTGGNSCGLNGFSRVWELWYNKSRIQAAQSRLSLRRRRMA